MRVVVQLTNDEITDCECSHEDNQIGDTIEIVTAEDELARAANYSFKRSTPIKAKLHLIDSKRLQLNFIEASQNGSPNIYITNRMTFDSVTSGSTEMLKNEISAFFNIPNGGSPYCIVCFTPRRLLNLSFLHKVTVGIDQHVEQTGSSVHMILVKYTTICGAMTVDMLAKSMENVNASSSPTSRPTMQFDSSYDLRSWLDHDFRNLWQRTDGHDMLEIQYWLMGSKENIRKVKFVVFNMYLEKMNGTTHTYWHDYMDYLGEGRFRAGHRQFNHCALTQIMRGYMEPALMTEASVLWLFEVPTQPRNASVTVDLLQMAHTIVQNRDKERSSRVKHCRIHNRPRRATISGAEISPMENAKEGISFTIPIHEEAAKKPRRLSEVIMRREFNRNQRAILQQPKLSDKEFNSLRSWYRRIDEKFYAVTAEIEKYCLSFYAMKTEQIVGELKRCPLSIETTEDLLEKLLPNFEQNAYNDTQLQQVQANSVAYRNSIDEFLLLKTEIKESPFAGTLKIYMETRGFELTQHGTQSKITNLELWQDNLNVAINEHVEQLRCELHQSNEDENNN